MAGIRICSQCGVELAADQTDEGCPVCRCRQEATIADAASTQTANPPAPARNEPAALAEHSPLASPPEGRPPTLRSFGDYEVIEEIARGAMGVVYKARP